MKKVNERERERERGRERERDYNRQYTIQENTKNTINIIKHLNCWKCGHKINC